MSSHHTTMQSPYGHMNNNIGGGSGHHNAIEYGDEFDEATTGEQEFYDDQGPTLEEDNVDDSEEDTEEASETEMGSSSNHRNLDEPIEIKEQMYQDKLQTLKKQLDELRTGTHPEYVRRVKKLEHQYNERIRLNEIYREYLISCVERDYILEKSAAVKEYEEKKIDLKENLMTDFEDRRKMIENERATMELTGDAIDVKPTITRKLRRRPNEPLPVPEKRRKPTTGQLVMQLDEKEIENDLRLISRSKAAAVHQMRPSASANAAAAASMNNLHMSSMTNASNAANYQINIGSSASGSSSTSASTAMMNNELTMLNSSSIPGAAAAMQQSSVAVPAAQSPSLQQQTPPPPGASQLVATGSIASNSSLGGGSGGGQSSSNQNLQPQTSGSNAALVVQATSTGSTGSQSKSQSQLDQSQQQQQQQQLPTTANPLAQQQQQQASQQQQPLVETRIEDGKLLYERRWFHRGQPVYVEGKDIPRFAANISAIGCEAIWVKKTSDGQKVRILTNQLSRGKVSIKRRAN